MKKYIVVISILISSVLFFACQDESKKANEQGSESSFLNIDPIVENKKEKPASYPLIIPAGENRIVGRILIASGVKTKPTVVFLHGNPGFEKNEETGQILRRGGYNSVFFSYSGTWGNKGIFGYNKSINDVKAVIQYLTKNSKQLRVDSENIYLCGFSMGADIAILSSRELKAIKGIISIDPWNGYYTLNQKTEDELDKYISNLEQRPCINIASGKAFVREIITNEAMDLKAALNNSTIHIFSSKKNKYAFEKYCGQENNENLIVLSSVDHSFSDKRIALAKTIYEWLEKNQRENDD